MDWEPAGKGVATPGGTGKGGAAGKKGRAGLVAVVVVVLAVILAVSSCGGKGDGDRLDWPSSGLAALLPKPSSSEGSVIVNSAESFSATVEGYGRGDYEGYVGSCKELGYTVEATDDADAYEAFSEEGHHLTLSFYESLEEMSVSLEAPVEMGALTWPSAGAASYVPAPDSTTGKIDSDSSTFFLAYVGETSAEACSAYMDACSDAGFSVDYSRGDTWYDAKNTAGVSLRVEYRGFDTMTVRVDVPDDVDAAVEAEAETEANATDADAGATTAPETSTGGTSDFRATMDAYEAFMNEYCDFMATYSGDSGNVVSMALDYASMMSRYAEWAEKVDAIDEGSLSTEDYAYYVEVMGRVTARLAEVGQ